MTGSGAVAVTGSTGALGGGVARRLADADVAQRLLVRDVARAPDLAGAGAVAFSYEDVDASTRALDGVDVLFMVSAHEDPGRPAAHRAFVDAAVAAGVTHVVYTSFVGAAPDSTFTLARDHHDTEQYIEASGLHHTFLRDNFYMEAMELFAGDDGVLRGPAGDGRAALVARDDVAAVAAAVLADPARHRGRTYDLTGPQALGLAEVASVISDVRGRAVSYHQETVDEAYESRGRYSSRQWELDAWVSTYTAIGSGELTAVTTAVEDVTGTPATSFESFLRRATD